MSNHSGSYMLNSVLIMLERESVFERLGKDKTHHLVREILEISDDYDCNSGEILSEIGERLSLCYYCRKPADKFRDGICERCHEEDI